jgi:hypothetical protein
MASTASQQRHIGRRNVVTCGDVLNTVLAGYEHSGNPSGASGEAGFLE